MNNQCDGCVRGTPIVNGVHKDEQGFGMACTKDRYIEKPKMSTELRTVPGTEIKQTRFYGGDDRGVCIQVTKSKHYPDNSGNYFDYIQLTRKQASLLAGELYLFADSLEVVKASEDE